MVLEPYSSVLRVYAGKGVLELVLRLAHLEALHIGALGGDGKTAVYLPGTVVGSTVPQYRRSYGGDTSRLVMAEDVSP